MASTGGAAEQFRLPAGTGLGRVRLQVSRLERSLEYYQEVLGFRVLSHADGRAVLGPGDGEALLELHERRAARPTPRGRRLGLYHFAILLPDRAALGRFVVRLSDLNVPLGASDHLVSEALYLQDPDGLGIEVYADRPRSAWEYAGAELRMATAPLDLASVAEAGRGEAWDGMPSGTIIGHVHLHVGDLARAAGIYEEALGLDRTVWSYPGALFLSAGGYHHHLGVNTWAAGAGPAAPDEPRLLDWELVAPDGAAMAAADRLEAAGLPVERDDGGATVTDPWGIALRLVDSRQRERRPA